MTKQIKNFWSLNVDEALVANWLKEKLKDCEVFFPVNFQFPDVDLIVYNSITTKTITIQVKSSQSYWEFDDESDQHYWASAQKFNLSKVDSDKVDFFIFSCYYSVSSKNVNNKTGPRNMKNYFVVFSTKKLKEYITKYKKLKIQKPKKAKFSFSIWPIDSRKESGDLYEDWDIKKQYKKDRIRQDIILKALENWKSIKTKLQ